MGQSLSQLYVHLIFSAKQREPLLLGALRGSNTRAFRRNIEGFYSATRSNTMNVTSGTERRGFGSPLQGSVFPEGPVTLGVAQGCVSSALRAS